MPDHNLFVARGVLAAMLAAVVASLLAPATVRAGGGPENVLLIVNPRSDDSMTIANHYAHLRRIPPENIVYVPFEPKAEGTDIDEFRKAILMPVLKVINGRRIGDQIDYIVYSSDFPSQIALDTDLKKIRDMIRKMGEQAATERSGADAAKPNGKEKPPPAAQFEWPAYITPVGSINGLTYLWQSVGGSDPAYLHMQCNHYVGRATGPNADVPSAAFHGNQMYGPPPGVPGPGQRRYFLSSMLGVITKRGNTLAEILAYLRRSAEADGTHPKGTIYLVKNNDIRSKVRHDQYPSIVRELRALGVGAEILDGTVPINKDDVQGVVMGTSDFNWKASGSTIRPGALCDNFTSYGGIMLGHWGGGQTPLTEFLRYGAAGATGTVAEPLLVPNKFPSPMAQVHYARGCSLAESLYQTIDGPYQLLLVGDPLCRPWADIPTVTVKGLEPEAVVHGSVDLQASAALPDGKAVRYFECFVDGKRISRCKPGEGITLDTRAYPDGYHQVRVVAIGPAPIESQGRQVIPIQLDNHSRYARASAAGEGPLRNDRSVRIAVQSPGSKGIVIFQGSRVVGQLAGEAGNIEIAPNTLGAGPVVLRAVGIGSGGADTHAIAKPLEFEME